VSLKIYNLLGQEVSTLIDADQTAGFHQETWNASSIASGTYIYRLVAKDASGKETVERKTMTLLK
jgi:serine protease AprX